MTHGVARQACHVEHYRSIAIGVMQSDPKTPPVCLDFFSVTVPGGHGK